MKHREDRGVLTVTERQSMRKLITVSTNPHHYRQYLKIIMWPRAKDTHTHTHTQSSTKGRHPSTSCLPSWPRLSLRSPLRGEGWMSLPGPPDTHDPQAPSSIQSSQPDKLMETNQLSGRTRRALHLPGFPYHSPPPPPLKQPPTAATTLPSHHHFSYNCHEQK